MTMSNSGGQGIIVSVLTIASALGCNEHHALDLTASYTELPLLNARPTTTGEHPYAAFLNIDIGGTVFCTGTLIAPHIVLTASHCVRCARFIDVTLLGGSPRTQRVAPEHIHTHPESATEPFDCSSIPLDNDAEAREFFRQIDTKTVVGRDLAIVELPQDSTAPPLPVLLTPPFGFNPLRELYGQSVTLVGRGNTSLECQEGSATCDLRVMRTGTASLDRYSSTVGGRADEEGIGLEEGPRRGPFLLNISRNVDSNGNQPPANEQAAPLSGDSGGPMIATVKGLAREIGVTSAGVRSDGQFGQVSFHVPTFLARNASFIRGFLNLSTSFTDSDGDDVEDFVDNCKTTYNPDQVDFDGDGIGFFCDNCEPTLDNSNLSEGVSRILEYDGRPASEFSRFANHDQDDCNADAEDEQVLARFPGAVAGLPGSITPQQYRAYFAGRRGQPVASFYLDTLLSTRRGDVCDPTPCSRGRAVANVRDPLAVGCSIFGGCVTRKVNGIAFTPIRANGEEPAKTGTTGFRFCACDHAGDDEATRRLRCGSSSSAQPCPIGAEHYSLNDPFWRTLSLNGQPPTTDVVTTSKFETPGSPLVFRPFRDPNAVGWDADADGLRIAGELHPRGILWSHVVTFDGRPTSDVDATDGITLAALASHYSSPDLTPVKVSPRVPLPDLPILACGPFCPTPWALGERFCPMCGRSPWILPDPDPLTGVLGIFGRNGDDAFDLTDRFSTVARDLLAGTLLAGARRIAASETEGRLAGARIVDRAVVLDAGFRITGSLRTAGVIMDGVLVSQTGANPLAQDVQQSALAFSASRGEIFALARRGSAGQAQLFRQTIAGTGWNEATLAGASIGGPKAMVYNDRDGSLYVLNQETSSSALDLLRIDLATGTSLRLDPAIAPAANGFRTALSIADSGELFVATSTASPASVDIRAFQISGDKLTLTRRLTRGGEILGGDIAAGKDDINYVQEATQGFVTHVTPHAAFDRCAVAPSNAVVCRPPALKAQLLVTTDWGTGYCVELRLTNSETRATVDWSATFNLRGTTIYNIWNLQSTGATGTVSVAPTADWNRVIAAGASSFSLGFCANRASASTVLPTDLGAAARY